MNENEEDDGMCPNCLISILSFNEFYNMVEINYDNKNNAGIKSSEDNTDIIVYEENEEQVDEEQVIKEELIDDNEKCNEENINFETEWITEDNGNQEAVEFNQSSSVTDFTDDLEDDKRIRSTACMFCDLCSAPLENLREAKTHYKKYHNTDGYIMCCERKFKQRCRLLEHVNTHFNYSYGCEICGKSFFSKSYLVKHLACHDPGKNYVSFSIAIPFNFLL